MEQKRRIARLEKEYTDWFSYYLPHYAKVPCAKYHKKMAKYMIENDEFYLINRIFRGGAKSVHANVGIPLFLYLAKQDLGFMLLIGENDIKAKKLLSDIQAELSKNKLIERDYGNRFNFGTWADGEFTTVDDVHFFALGIGQSPRGIRDLDKRPDYISVDDVDNKKRKKNPKLVRELFEYLKEDVWGTFGMGKKRYIHSNNRFSKNTVVHMMSEHFENVIKKYKEAKLKVVHAIIVAKAVLANGESSWPEAYPIEHWKKERINKGEISFLREYQDEPIEVGTVFKNEWISWKQMEHISKYDALIVYGDLSYKDKGDFKALLLIGKIGREFHVIKAFVRRSSRANAAHWLYDLYEDMKLDKIHWIRYKIEGLFNQDEFVHDFDIEGDARGYYIPVSADKKPKINKEERIESMSPFFERGNVHFNIKEQDTPDFVELVNQILGFEKSSGMNDDGPDCLQSGMSELNNKHANSNFVKTVSRKEMIGRNKNRF
ncbi:MAG: hypothetical protein PHQ74_15165 [Crocinitomicaceae bacterium]|nr:hypothetical protein [Crocinitomicaceae bacterium]